MNRVDSKYLRHMSLQLDGFVVSDMVAAFTLDGLANSHPIKVPVNHPDEINEIFDSISYNKVSFCLSPFFIVAVDYVSSYICRSHSVASTRNYD